jgi:hypothetical protein
LSVKTIKSKNLEATRIKKERDANLTQAIEKIVAKQKYHGDKIVFKNDEEFAQAGMDILKKYVTLSHF